MPPEAWPDEVEEDEDAESEAAEEEAAPKAAPPKAEPKRIVLSPSDPMNNARKFMQECCMWRPSDAGADAEGVITLWRWQHQFWKWNGCVYVPDDKDDARLESELWKFFDGAKRRVMVKTDDGEDEAKPQYEPFRPEPRHISAAKAAITGLLRQETDWAPPMWLVEGERRRNTDWIAFANRVVNIMTGEVREHSPEFWAHSALPFDYDPDAVTPRWEQFLEEIFPGDTASQDFIEEWLGYNMTEDVRFHKGALFISVEGRCGKGTIARVMNKLVGLANYLGLDIDLWTKGENSRAPLIGKRAGVFPDMRLKGSRRFGKNLDVGGMDTASVRLMLSITGGDHLTIPRKYIEEWTGQLPIKLTILSNDVPNFNDRILPDRWIKLYFRRSFAARPDPLLDEKLAAELPGIAVRAMAAYRRLRDRDYFVQPASAEGLEQDVRMQSDPTTRMAYSLFIADRAGTATKSTALARAQLWLTENGYPDLALKLNDKNFGKTIRAVHGFEHIDTAPRPRDAVTGKQGGRRWLGLRFRYAADDHDPEDDE
jgi:putative DNA primase/helicase